MRLAGRCCRTPAPRSRRPSASRPPQASTTRRSNLRRPPAPAAAGMRAAAAGMPDGAAASGSSSDAQLDALAQEAIVWASQHGLVVGLGGSAPPAALIHAPLSLLPVAFPESRFLQAKAAMTVFNTLIDRVAADEAYLAATLANAAQQDEFTARLLALMQGSGPSRAVAAAAGVPEVVLGIHRSDYMLDGPSGGFLQVELNTIASSFGCLSTLTTQLHHHVLGLVTAGGQQQQRQPDAAPPLSQQRLPENEAMQGIARAMAAAVTAAGGPGAVMVMIVQPGERNAYDQQWLQQTLWAQHGVATRRLTLAQAHEQLTLVPDGSGRQRLVLGDGKAVGLAYFRAGYTPDDYPSDVEWQARALIEASSAAKCPTAAYQLAGCKKVQQDLATPGVLERFLGEQDAATLRHLFAGLWSLDDPADPATAAVIADARAHPERYVLKPQREGGGNNLYGQELAQALGRGLEAAASAAPGGGGAGAGGLAAYILMQRILPPPQRSVFVRRGEWAVDESLSELGIYGTFLRVGGEVVLNEEVGHLVRTKTASSNEGGVAAGYAVLDSPLLAAPGEGLLPPQLEAAGGGAGGGGAGAWGGVLALAASLLQQEQQA